MRRILSPKWILIHIGLLSLVALMVALGFWQLQRLEDRQARNAEILENTTREAVQATVQFGTDNIEWRRVTLSGRYVPGSEFYVINRSQDGVAGDNVAAAFTTTDGKTFVINRGFVPLAETKPSSPQQQLSLIGYVRTNQTRGTLGAIDSSQPGTKEFQRYDLARIKSALRLDINTDFYVQLIEETPQSPDQWPDPVPLPDVDEGPHFSYAMQWFFFSLVAAAGWAVVVTRKIRETPSGPSPEQTSA